jgi:aminopeptidase N
VFESTRRALLGISFVIVFAACAAGPRDPSKPVQESQPSPQDAPAVASSAPIPREDGRLPPLARPERYSLSLTIDPTKPRFSGTTRILTSIPGATSFVVLHGHNLDVKRAAARVGRVSIPATVTTRAAHGGHDPEELVLAFAKPLPAGEATLEIAYEAPFDDSLAGLYRVNDGQRWYAFTQFEATDARRAFPCFDEPGFKVAFDVSITVPKETIAVANTPETTRHDAGAWTTFDFATTAPLPSYLVAFAVGDFDVREGPADPVPIRLIATKGKGALGELAVAATAALTRELAGYFGIAYPYPKLDIVAVPNFAAGAMENAGLITFREELLLVDPAHASMKSKRSQALVLAHELAHQWFGDLVTMAWWNDLWLNEGFATWAAAKIGDRYKPTFEARTELVAGMSGVMDTDSLHSARAVRQPVTSTSEAMEAFDGITYDKGAAVLGMIEHSIGDEVFQRGVRSYLVKNAWGNATADDLLHALDEASGKDVTSLASSFLDRAGVPNVSVSVGCTGQRSIVRLKQSPWRRLGDPGAQAALPPWWIPVGLTTGAGERAAKLLASPEDEVLLAKCPSWIYPNTDQAGYYRFSLEESSWVAMTGGLGRLSTANRVGFVANLWAQTRAGDLAPEVVLRTLPAVDREKDRFVIGEEIEVLHGMSDALVVEEARPAFRRYAAARLLPHMKALAEQGVSRDERSTLLERSLVAALGELADDDATLREAEKVTEGWLRDPDSVDPDLASIDVTLGSRRAGPDRIEALRTAIRNAKSPENRTTALRALGGFGDATTLDHALDVILTDDVRTQDVLTVLYSAMGHRASRATTFEWVTRNWEGVRSKLPGFLAGRTFGLAGFACSKEERTEAADFFEPRTKEIEGTERPLAEALEAASLCLALRDKYASSVTRFFAPAPLPKEVLAPAPPVKPAAATKSALSTKSKSAIPKSAKVPRSKKATPLAGKKPTP